MKYPPLHEFPHSQLTGAVIGAAIAVHKSLGPGVIEGAYEEALAVGLARRGIANRRQVPLPLTYKETRIDCGYRLDLLVEDHLPLELKAVIQLHGLHEAQMLTYLRIGRYPIGLLINFNVGMLRKGIRRFIETRDFSFDTTVAEMDCRAAQFSKASATVVKAAVEVHRHLGPGLLASAYEECICYELALRDLAFERRKVVPLAFEGQSLAAHVEVPLLVDGQLPVLIYCVESIESLHVATALARLRQGAWHEGLILNFNAVRMSECIKRVVL